MRRLKTALLALGLPLALSACGDPLRDVERLNDVQLPPETPVAAAVPPPAEQADAPGFLFRILGGTLDRGPTLAPAPAPGDADAIELASAVAIEAEAVSADAAVPEIDPAMALELASVLQGAPADGQPGAEASGEAVVHSGTDAIEGDTDMAQASAPVPAAPRRRGLFGLLNVAAADVPPPATGPDAARIAPGTTLAYGEIATVCGLGESQLGTFAGAASGYTLYDTDPGQTGPRTHYITGFQDGCARQFHGALALFGDVGTHEVIRYSQGAGDLPFSRTDVAYEEIKAQVCGVPSGQPCGAALDRLAARTTFLTVYANFGSNVDWAEILLSEGQVVAKGFEG